MTRWLSPRFPRLAPLLPARGWQRHGYRCREHLDACDLPSVLSLDYDFIPDKPLLEPETLRQQVFCTPDNPMSALLLPHPEYA